jgi:Domain of unknown function (DUF4357)
MATLPSAYRALREKLKADKVLIPGEQQRLRFTRDVPFTSPTAAACVVYGASISGPGNWKVKATGQTYAEVREDSLREAEAVGGRLSTRVKQGLKLKAMRSWARNG